MGETSIARTNFSFNPWFGCTEVSPGCDHCYARELMDRRLGKVEWGHGKPRVMTSDAYWKGPLRWNEEAKFFDVRTFVFCASLGDVFDAEVPDEWRRRLWGLIEATPALTWQLLTKRPSAVTAKVPVEWLRQWPANVWLGTSVEGPDQLWRAAELCKVPGGVPVKFLSLEPLLAGLDVSIYLYTGWDSPPFDDVVNWVIVGGESGRGFREMDPDWVIDIVDACALAQVPVFVKQDSGLKPGLQGRLLDVVWARKEMPGVRA